MTDLADTALTDTLAPAPAFRRVQFAMSGGEIAGVAMGDETRAPDILFLHATGMNALAYRSLLAPLAEKFHVVAVDLRGHGRTSLPAKTFGYASWGKHRDDVVDLLETHFDQPLVLAGHSMGATVSLLVAGKSPDLVNGLALIEPVILSPATYSAWRLLGAPAIARTLMPIARASARRREHYPDAVTAIAALKQRGIFRAFSSEALADYVEDGFLADERGELRLACKRNFEAATYGAQRHDPWRALTHAPRAISMLRAEHGSTISKAAARRFGVQRRDARIATVEGATHALPWERPDRTRAAIEMALLMVERSDGVRRLDLD